MTGLYAKIKQTDFRRLRRITLIAGAVFVGTFQIFGFAKLRINTSSSLPLGLYIEDSQANLVEFCPAEPFATLAIQRGYRDAGSCPDGAAPLLKQVVALPGDLVQLSRKGIAVNGQLLPNTAPLARDTHGRPLQSFPQGPYTVARDSVWVASSYNFRSFDSRYFGPLPKGRIRAHLRPLLTLW